jgi:thioredoxin 1
MMSRSGFRSSVLNHCLAATFVGLLAGTGAQAGASSEAGNPVTTDTFNDRVVETSNHTPVVVEFYAEWCGYCRKLAPILDSLAREYQGRVHFVRVDVDADPDVAARFGIDGVPAVFVFDAGLPLARVDGAVSRRELRDMVDAFSANQ